MNQDQCNSLRDIIFSHTFKPNGHERPHHLFRYVGVAPGGQYTSEAIATVSYCYSPVLWKDRGLDAGVDTSMEMLAKIIADAGFNVDDFELVFNEPQGGWSFAWSLTAKHSNDNIPALIMLEEDDGSVTGVLMRNGGMGDHARSIGNSSAEPDEASIFIEQLRALDLDDISFGGLFKEANIDAASLDEAIKQTPESDAGQKYIYLYRNHEWLYDIWNSPKKNPRRDVPLSLNSIADIYGTRISDAKKQSRQELDIARKNKTLAGNYDELLSAIAMSESSNHDDLEQSPGVRWLCDWWNRGAPENMRFAGCFRIYIWDESNRIFLATDPDEPACSPGVLASEPSYALFEENGQPTVQITFYKGRSCNTHESGTSWTYYANGERGLSLGCDLSDVDEAYYSHQGLIRLADIVEFAPTE